MKELKRISHLFSDLYNGDPWIDVNIMDTLKSLTAEEAAKKVFANSNSIWQIVNHMMQWRKNILKRLGGEIKPSPADNYFSEIPDNSEAAWKTLLDDFENTHQEWLAYLEKTNEDFLEKTGQGNHYTNYGFIHGILQHDAYHLGQVAMLAKQVKNKAGV